MCASQNSASSNMDLFTVCEDLWRLAQAKRGRCFLIAVSTPNLLQCYKAPDIKKTSVDKCLKVKVEKSNKISVILWSYHSLQDPPWKLSRVLVVVTGTTSAAAAAITTTKQKKTKQNNPS